MKKNIMMRVASVMLIAVLLSTCTISGTFAKYVTTETGFDEARVAKFGVTITANGNMFGSAYVSADGTISTTYNASTDSVHNNGSVDTLDLVAPGTGDGMVAMTISGAPEVDVHVSYVATLTLTGWEVDGDEYCPIIFTVNGETYGMAGLGNTLDYDYATIDLLKAAVVGAIGTKSANYEANTDLSTAATPSVSWEWPFYVSDANDKKDTKLGNAAAAGSAATIRLDIQTSVTQID